MDENPNRLLTEEFLQMLQKAEDTFIETWDKIGLCEDQRRQRNGVIIRHIKSLVDEMLTEEKVLLDKLLKNIEMFTTEMKELSDLLCVDPVEPEEMLTLLQYEKTLRSKVGELSQLKQKRQEKLKKLRNQNEEFATLLGSEPFYVAKSANLSEELLDQVKAHTKTLLAEKEERINTFEKLKNNILDLFDELEQSPASFERDIHQCEKRLLSLDTLNQLTNLEKEMKHTRSENQSQTIILREKLNNMWDRLKIEQDKRDTFNTHFPGYTPSSMKALMEEIEKCKLIQKQNIKKLVLEYRERIAQLWEMCYYSNEQKDLFRAFHN